MVHALQRAGQRLRPGGTLVSIRPHLTFRPQVALRTGTARTVVARLINSSFEVRLSASQSALERVVRLGSFRSAGSVAKRYHVSLDRISQVRDYLELISPPRPRFPPGTRARLEKLWAAAPPTTRIEITEWLIVDALRRVAGRQAGRRRP